MGTSPSEKVASRYAEIFVSVFDRIEGDPSLPLVAGGRAPQAGITGTPFRGSNALVTSLYAAERGFGIPVWLTKGAISDLGLLINRGERNVPIVKYDIFYESTETHKRDPQMDDARYRALSDEDKKKWVKRCYMSAWPEFNIAQTNFSEVYPVQWKALVEEFGSPMRVDFSCAELDRLVGIENPGEGDWLCPIIRDTEKGLEAPMYQESYDRILVPDKGVYANQERYYSDLLHEMAHSTGSEGRMDRNLSSTELSQRAQEELVAELAGATAGTMLGIQTGIREHNLGFLKAWSSMISEDPKTIYLAVNDAAKAAECISGTLGLTQRPGFDLQRVMDGVEAAKEARQKAQERREARAQAAAKGKGGKKAWKVASAPKKGRKF